MIQHIVLLKWKPDTTEAQINEAFHGAQKLVDGIDSVERITLGRNRGEADHGFTHALIVRLSDDESPASYLHSPVRERYVTEVLAPITSDRIEIDVPEDAHLERDFSGGLGWDWDGARPSASAAAAALRWEEKHPDE